MTHDIEKPYQDACKRENAFDRAFEKSLEEIWYDVKEPLLAESLLDDYENNPSGELGILLSLYAQMKAEKLVCKETFWQEAEKYFNKIVEFAAKHQAEKSED